jgi:hypothetical protein
VPVKLINVVFYADAAGSRIVDVNNGGDGFAVPSIEAAVKPPVTTTRTFVGVTLSDLLEAGVLQPGEPIEWRRPQVGELHHAVVAESGEVVLSDGRTFTSLSTAADKLTGGSHNGWETWTVPRHGGVRIGALRNSVPSAAEQ